MKQNKILIWLLCLGFVVGIVSLSIAASKKSSQKWAVTFEIDENGNVTKVKDSQGEKEIIIPTQVNPNNPNGEPDCPVGYCPRFIGGKWYCVPC